MVGGIYFKRIQISIWKLTFNNKLRNQLRNLSMNVRGFWSLSFQRLLLENSAILFRSFIQRYFLAFPISQRFSLTLYKTFFHQKYLSDVRPELEKAKNVQGCLMINHNDSRSLQIRFKFFKANHFPGLKHKIKFQIHFTISATQILQSCLNCEFCAWKTDSDE